MIIYYYSYMKKQILIQRHKLFLELVEMEEKFLRKKLFQNLMEMIFLLELYIFQKEK